MASTPNTLVAAIALAACSSLLACQGVNDQKQQVAPAAPVNPVSKPPSPAPITKPAPPTPIQQKRIELGGPTWSPAWSRVVERALPPGMLSSRVPSDVRTFCPRFYRLRQADKRAFWAYFFQALAGSEASLDPTSNVRHTEPEVAKRDRVTGEMVRSEGLLQLTYEDQKRYGCDFDWQADKELSPHDPAKTILQPKNNLLCGVRILAHQILVQRKPLVSPTSYWSSLHPGTPSYLNFAKQMINPPAACGLHSTNPRVLAQNQPLAHPAIARPGETEPIRPDNKTTQ